MKHVIGLTLVAALLLSGCGGSGGGSEAAVSSRDSGLRLSVHWPERSRLVPEAANSMKFVVTPVDQPDSPFRIERVVERPTEGFVSEVVVGNLPAVFVKVQITAHPELDGTGVAQAEGNLVAQLLSEQTVHKEVVLNSTVSKVKVESLSSTTVIDGNGSIQLAKDEVVKVLASARDDLDRVVVTAQQKWSWLSTAEDVVKVVVTGSRAPVDGIEGVEAELTALKSGNASVSVTEQESGKKFMLTAGVDAVEGSVALYPLGVASNGQEKFVRVIANDARTFIVNEWVTAPSLYRDGVFVRSLTESVDFGTGWLGNEDFSRLWLWRTDATDYFNRSTNVSISANGAVEEIFAQAPSWNVGLHISSGDGKVVFGTLETDSSTALGASWTAAGLRETFDLVSRPITVNYDGSVYAGRANQTDLSRFINRNGIRAEIPAPPVYATPTEDRLSGDGNRLFAVHATAGQDPRTFTLYMFENGAWSQVASHDVEFGTPRLDVSYDGTKVLLNHSSYGTPADPVIWDLAVGTKLRLEDVFSASGVAYDTGTIWPWQMSEDGKRVAGVVEVGGAWNRFIMTLP